MANLNKLVILALSALVFCACGQPPSSEEHLADPSVDMGPASDLKPADMAGPNPDMTPPKADMGEVGTRDPTKHPFASNHPFNTSIGKGATYKPAGLKPAKEMGYLLAEEDIIVMTPTAPSTKVHLNTADWVPGADRCDTTGPVLFSVPIPKDFVVAGTWPDNVTPNSCVSILSADGRTVIQTQPFARCTAGMPATSHYLVDRVDLYGTSATGCHGGSGLSGLAGTLRMGEMMPGSGHVRHALKVEMDGSNYAVCLTPGTCFRWPAVQADWASASYTGTNPDLKPGALLALLATLDIKSLGLKTGAAKELAWTLQHYGAYVIDNTGWDIYAIAVERGTSSEYNGRYVEEFKDKWGFDFAPANPNNNWSKDIATIFAALQVVTNNSPTSIGGPGDRLDLPLPALKPL